MSSFPEENHKHTQKQEEISDISNQRSPEIVVNRKHGSLSVRIETCLEKSVSAVI